MIEYSDIFLSDLFSNAYILLTTQNTLPLKNNHAHKHFEKGTK